MSDTRLPVAHGTGGHEPNTTGTRAGVFTKAVHMDDPATVQIPPTLTAEEVAVIVAKHSDQPEPDPTYDAGQHSHAAAAHTHEL